MPDGCWLWGGAFQGKSRTPIVRLDRRAISVMRALMYKATGNKQHNPIRLCDERRCVNPEHFRWGPMDGVETRVCSHCGREKQIANFKWSDRTKVRRRGECNSCCVAKEKKRKFGKMQEDPVAWKLARMAVTIKHKYGLTLDEIVAMYQHQGGCCAICGDKLTAPHIDHCHSTGKVRGLLCRGCNFGIGWLRDESRIAKSAVTYLEEHAA